MHYKSDLINNILPIWLNNAIDYENGGIYTCLDREGNIYGREKSVWFQGRALWVFCKTYNTIAKDEAYLTAAKCIYDFLPKCTGPDGRMPFTSLYGCFTSLSMGFFSFFLSDFCFFPGETVFCASFSGIFSSAA